MVEVSSNEYYLVVQKTNGDLYYRLFGQHDDALWRRITNYGEFRGAFSWPSTAYMYVFYGSGSSTHYRVIKRSSASIGSTNISNIQQLESWLRERMGVSLSHLTIIDGSRYAGLTLYQFFTLEYDKDLASLPELWRNFLKSIYEAHYHQHGKKYIDYVAGQLDGNDDWKDWKRADELVREFTTSSRTLQQVLIRAFGWPREEDRSDTSFRSRNTSGERSSFYTGPNGLANIAPTSGKIQGKSAASRKQFAYRNSSGQLGVFRTTFTRNGDELSETTPSRIAPRITGPYDISEHYSEEELQFRKSQIESVYTENEGGPVSNLEYVKEAYYFIPVYVALQLQRRSHYTEALDWFRTVYDYSMPKPVRKIYYGLAKEESLTNSYERAEDWLLDPLNPHSIAATRINTYTRFTLLATVRCFLDYADAEFTRDTAESVPRARILYMTALELLESEDLKLQLGFCSDLAGSLEIEIGDPKWERVWIAIKAELVTIKNPGLLIATATNIKNIWATNDSVEVRFTKIRDEITKAKATQPPSKTLETVIAEKSQYLAQSHEFIQSSPVFAQAVAKMGQVAAHHYANTVSMVTGVPIYTLEKKETTLSWMREPIKYQAMATVTDNSSFPLRTDFLEATVKNPIAKPYISKVADYALENPLSAVKIAGSWLWYYIPAPSFNFYIPTNPIIEALQLRAELNLYKIRTCRNIAGVERELDLYAAPTDTVSGLPVIGAGSQLSLPGAVTFMPTPHRYTVIIERAKQLVSLAQQIEAAFLSAIEKRDAEFYNLMKARQDIRTTRAGIRLQDLRIKTAEGEVKLSELQKDRAQLQADHYKTLLDEGVSGLEIANLTLLGVTAALQTSSAVLSFVAAALPSSVSAGFPGGVSVAYSPSGSVSSVASGLSSLAAAASTTASIMATLASYERRAQEWEFQRSVAMQDVKIGSQQVKISQSRLRVVGQERYIANLQAEHAQQTAEFLATKFTNVELYDWMSDILEGVYRFFLQQATSMAQLATSQLAFERQELPPPFIQDDYWEVKEDAVSGGVSGENPTDRRGLTGSARLLQDIFQLDQFAFETDERKNQLTKNISLMSLAPAEFQQFKETGVLNFATPMELFDWDFPSDYLRLIKRIRVSVIALIPAIDSIKATLTTIGNSRVTVGGDIFQTINLNRGPEVVALSSPRDATGLFELQPQISDKLNPFEGMGVDTQWQFKLPKAANRFDFNSIADVIVTIEYTSLSSFTYRQQVIQKLNNKISAERPFSFRTQFSDQWYDLNNPNLTSTPMIVNFDTREADFPPNIDNLKIKHVVLYFVRTDGLEIEVPVTYLRFTENGNTGAVGGGATSIDGVISTRRGNASSWISMIGKSPYGDWELSLNDNLNDGRSPGELLKNEEITDILFVITYSGNTPEWSD
jgi:Tc toxin complex TcA C-terminal TcB-binding domain